jgi:hypothetical protein
MPHVFQPAPTGRAKCRGCGERIAAGVLRFGESLPNPFAEGETTHWFHLECAAFKRPEPLVETLEASGEGVEDKERLLAQAKLGIAHRRLPRVSGAERAPTGQAQCRSCRERIGKGVWRIPLVFYEEGRFAAAGFIHLPCALAYLETTDVLPRLKRFSPALSDDDLREIEAELRGPARAAPPDSAPPTPTDRD